MYDNSMISTDISGLLREQRMKKGFSLSRLARLTNTSPATLSRYENGWQRFEIYTLRKIASALGCRLKVELEPLREEVVSNDETVVDSLRRLFWDKPFELSDIELYPKWVVGRVLESGSVEDIHMLVNHMGRERFLDAVSQVKFSSRRTENFWREMLKKENVKCMKKCSRATAGNYWPN